MIPQWKLTSFDSVMDHNGNRPRLIVNVYEEAEMLALCAHDCEIENVRTRSGLLVAPVQKPPFKADSESWTTLLAADFPDDAGNYRHIHLFPIRVPSPDGESIMVIDFSRLVSVGPPEKVKAIFKEKRTHQMSELDRGALQAKLSAFVSRGGDVWRL